MYHASSVHEQITALMAEALHLEVPSVDTDLFDSGVLDSLTFVELLLLLEREFGVVTSVDDLEVDNFRSITQIADFVIARTAAANTSDLASVAALGRQQ